MNNNTKFVWNGIKVNGKLYRCWYSTSKLLHYPEGTITIYGRHYEDLPHIDGLNVQNDSEMQTDYFENDRIRVTPDNKYYNQVKQAVTLQNEHQRKIWDKKRLGVSHG